MAVTSIGNLQPHNVHTDVFLSNLAIGFNYPDLIGDRISQRQLVSKQSDKYLIYYNDDENRLVTDSRGPGGDFNEVEWALSNDSFYADCHGLRNSIPWETLANADPGFREYLAGQAIAQRLKHHCMLNREVAIKGILTTTANYASGYTENMDSIAGRNFDDVGANGMSILRAFVRLIKLQTGGGGIKMVVTGDCYELMLADASFMPTFTQDLLAQESRIIKTLGIEEIIVVDSQYNSADKALTPVRTAIWPANSIWLITVAPPGGDLMPTTLRTFVWQNSDLGTSSGEAVRVIVDQEHMVNRLQYVTYYGLKATGVDRSDNIVSGVFLQNVYDAI